MSAYLAGEEGAREPGAVGDGAPTRSLAGGATTGAPLCFSAGDEGSTARAALAGGLGPGTRVKHYELVRPLGQGGMGSVYLARDTKLGRLVALKFLLHHSGRAAERLLAEARATAQCRHESIVVLYEADEVEGRPYLVLEHLEGKSLDDWLRERSRQGSTRVTVAQALELVLPVVKALACAHAHGLVHRDLKPSNVFLTDEGVVKVLDFGIAKLTGGRAPAGVGAARREGAAAAVAAVAAEGPAGGAEAEGARSLTEAGVLVGSLPFMAPEQWRGAAVDARTDLWAVGLLLYRLVAGAHPFGAFPSTERLAFVAVLEEPMPSLSDARPDAGALAAVVDRCLKKRPDERFASARALLEALEPLRPGWRAPVLGDDGNPFAGLSAFQESDAARFFGRDADIAAALGRLRHRPLLAVTGPSGAGKSSFVRAGLLPALRRSAGSADVAVLRPGAAPLAALAELLAAAESGDGGEREPPVARPGREVGALAARVAERPGLVGRRLRDLCRRRGEGHRMVVFVDQFEELYTLGASADERRAFVEALGGVADDAASPLRLLLSVRSDFLDRVTESRAFAAELTRGLLLLPALGPEALAETLCRPLEAAGYRFESDETPRQMLRALAGSRAPLPLLQFTAGKLWEARDRERRLLTHRSYEALGGVSGALSGHADAVLAAMSADERRLCRAVFLRLVTAERTRAVIGVRELAASVPGAGGALEAVVQRLADARLLLVEPSADGGTVELVHESLLGGWARLKQWLDESEGDALFLARLRTAAHAWAAGDEHEGLLWRERAADEARKWLARRRERGHAADDLGEREARFLRAVAALSERARRRRRATVVGLFASLATVATAVSFLAVRAEREAGRAQAQAARADREAFNAQVEARQARDASRLALARQLVATDPTTALALLREVEGSPPPDDWAELASWALRGGVSLAVLAHPAKVLAAAYRPDGRGIATACDDGLVRVWDELGLGEPTVLPGHEGGVTAVAFAPDGERLASASSDKTVRVRSADGSGEAVVLRGHDDAIMGLAFSPDGRRLATASSDKTVRVWNADGSGAPLVLRGHEHWVSGVAFGPDGRTIASASLDGTVRVWNADGAAAPRVLRGHRTMVSAVAFGPDGRRLASTSVDQTVRLWALDAPPPRRGAANEALAVGATEDHPWFVTFSPDGRRLVTTSSEGTVRVWEADGLRELFALRGHENGSKAIAFRPDGQRFVTASRDGTVRVWGADGSGQPLALRGHDEVVQSAAFSPDGARVVSGSDDRTVRVWNADGTGAPLVLRGHGAAVVSTAFDPGGGTIASASFDGTVRVWKADGSGAPLVLRGHEGPVVATAWSPDGRRLASGSVDKTVRIWDGRGRDAPVVLRGHEGDVWGLAFSDDGRRIASSSADMTVRVWNADGSGEPRVFRGHGGAVLAVAFTPEGGTLSAAQDHGVGTWGADGAGATRALPAGEGDFVALALSPDGRYVASAANDKAVRLWPLAGAVEPLVLRGHEGNVSSIAFRRDGRRIVTTSEDKTLRIWSDFAPLSGRHDRRLWDATAYCPSAARRQSLLHSTPEAAVADERACRERVRAAHAAARPSPR